MTIRLLQLSDCHLQEDSDSLYRGINPETNLLRCLQAASSWEPDVILLSGDLADRPTAPVYQRLNDYFKNLGTPTLAFPGNHDQWELMQKHLTDTTFINHNPWQHENWQIVWLDSNLAGQPHGELDREKLMVLDRIHPERPTLLALHHQPVNVGTPWIDRFKLTNPELLWEKLDDIEHNIKAITWGHIHHGWHGTKSVTKRSIHLYGAPSTSACATPGCKEFELDIRGPRFRWMLLNDDGGIDSGLLSVA